MRDEGVQFFAADNRRQLAVTFKFSGDKAYLYHR